jgi:hypothetical protein
LFFFLAINKCELYCFQCFEMIFSYLLLTKLPPMASMAAAAECLRC